MSRNRIVLVAFFSIVILAMAWVRFFPQQAFNSWAQVIAAVTGPFTGTNGADYYVVTSTLAGEDTGDEVCASLGLECLGYTQIDDTVCMLAHPGASQVTDTSGDRTAVYCDGAPQAGICAGLTNTCLECPTCTNSVSCSDPIGGLYREMYVQCGPATGTSEITGIKKVSDTSLNFVAATLYNPDTDEQFAIVRNTNTDSNTLLSSAGVGDLAMGIASDSSSNMFVVYGEDDSGSSSYDIYLAKLSSNGAIVWDTLLSGLGSFANFHSVNGFLDVVPDEAGGAFVLLTIGDTFSFTTPTLYHVTFAGAVSVGYPITLTPNTADMVATSGNGVLVLSDLGENLDTFDYGHGVVERYTSAGLDATWNSGAGEQVVSTNTTSLKYSGVAIGDGNDGIIIIWADDESGEEGIYGQRIDSDGNISFDWDTRGDRLVVTSESVTGISADYFDEAYAAYSLGNTIEVFDFDTDGESRNWSCNQTITGTSIGDFQIIADDYYGPYLLWTDESGADTGLYAQNFDAFTGDSIWEIGGVLIDDADSNGGSNFNVSFGSRFSGAGAQHDSGSGVDVFYSYNDGIGQPVFSANFDGNTYPSGPGGDCIPVADPVQVLPADNATVPLKPYLSAQYVADLDLGVTNYRVSSSSLADCVNDTNIVYTASSNETTRLNEATGIVVESSIADGNTYYWCAQNEDVNSWTSNWAEMGSFTVDLTTPAINYSMYLGGSSSESPMGIALGSDGIIYVTGGTSSTDFPTSAGYDTTFNAEVDAYVVAIDPQATGATDLVFSTFIGGDVDDYGRSIKVDATTIYIAGSSDSTDYPTTGGAYDTTNAASDLLATVTTLNLSGDTLGYSTYVGTGNNIQPTDMDIDGGDVYVAGNVTGSSLPTTAGAFDTAIDTSTDGFLFRLSPDGAGSADLVYSTYFGGNSSDESIETLDVASGIIYFGMYTSATNMPTTAGALDTTDNTGRDSYIGRLNPAGTGASDLTYGSYVGGNGANEVIRGVSVNSGIVYATGFTNSSDFPVTAGSYVSTYPGSSDGFILALNPAGTGASDLVYGTFTNGLLGFGLEYNAGFIYLFGRVGSGLTTTDNAFDAVLTSTQSAFGVMKLEPAGDGINDLVYASLIESNDPNSFAQPANDGMVFDPSTESLIFTGEMTSHSYPVMAVGGDPYDFSYNGGTDAVITRITFADGVPNPPVAPILRFPDDGAVRAGKVFLSVWYEHDVSVGTTDYRVSTSSTTDCVNNVNVVDSGSSATTTGILQPTMYQTGNLPDATYYWCARNNDGTQQSAWTAMGSFVKDHTAPYPNYISYLGGTGQDFIYDVDFEGDTMYFTGKTNSTDIPVTVGSYDTTYNTNTDVLVGGIQFNGAGADDMVFLTYIGGTGNEQSWSIIHDGTDIYIAGWGNSTNFPTTLGAYDTTHNGADDGFALRLDSVGTTLEYSTYIGSTSSDLINIEDVVDGVMYLGGYANTSNFPVTAGAYDTTYNGGIRDSVIVVLDPAGNGAADLQYSTYIGGSVYEFAPKMASIDGLIYFTLDAFSSNFPSLPGGYDSTHNGSLDTVFGRLDPAGGGSTDMQYLSFLGTTSSESVTGAAFDRTTGEIYVVGNTGGSGFPTTVGAYDTSFTGFSEGYLIKFDTAVAGTGALEYSTFISQSFNNIAFDGTDVYLVGSTSDNNPLVTPATTYGNEVFFSQDAYLLRLNPGGNGVNDLIYASIFGVDGTDEHFRGVDVQGDIVYLGGYMQAYSLEAFSATGTPFQTTVDGSFDKGLIMRIDFAGAGATNSAPTAPTNLFANNTNAQAGLSNPIDLTAGTPVFSAICNDPDIGDVMNAYRVQVDDTDSTFASILWDSGKQSMADCVDGNRSQNINFGGAALAQDGSTYYVRIKFWDDNDTEGEYSTSADSFTMGSPAPAPSQSDGISQQQRQQIQQQNEQNQQSPADESNDEEPAEEEPIDEPVEEPVDEPIEEETMEEPEDVEALPVLDEEISEPAKEKPVEQESVPAPTQEEVGQVGQVVDRLIEDEIGISVDDLEEPAAPEPQTITTVSSDGESFTLEVVREQGEEEQEALLVTGIARVGNGQIEFSGTTSQPNSTVTLIFNGNITVIVVSDDEGFWQTYVSAEQLGLLPGERVNVSVQVIASKGNLLSDRVSVGGFTVERGANEQIVEADFETIAAPNELSAFINAVTNKVEEIIQDREEEIQQTLTVAAPVVVISSAPLWGYLPYLPTLLYHAITYLVGLVGRRKKGQQRFFGVAYDAITKDPLALAIVRLYKKENASERLVSTFVTDKQGKYDFLLEPGSYRIDVKKPQYSFPSSIVSETSEDGAYDHVYQGGIEITDQTTELVVPDLPLDPVNAELKWETANIFKKLWLSLQKAGNFLALPLLFAGSLVSVVVVAAVPENPINWILSVAYVLMFLLQLKLRQKPQKAWGIVYDIATNAPLPLVNLQLIDPAFGKVVASRLSDYQGRFRFTPEPGKYVVRAEKDGYAQAEVVEGAKNHRMISGELVIEKENQTISGDIPMRLF